MSILGLLKFKTLLVVVRISPELLCPEDTLQCECDKVKVGSRSYLTTEFFAAVISKQLCLMMISPLFFNYKREKCTAFNPNIYLRVRPS